MRRSLNLLAIGVLAFSATFSETGEGQKAEGQKAEDRKAVPDAKDQARVETLLQELFKDDLAKSKKDSAVRSRLAHTFLLEGRDTEDDVAGRYVLYRQARDLAAQAGDAPIALQAIEDMARDYQLPANQVLDMKIDALLTASKAVASPDAYHTVVDTALILLEEAVNADNYGAARKLAATADNAATKLKSVPLVASVRKRQEEIASLEKKYAEFKPFAERLTKNAKDSEASTEMGKYYALRKGNWDAGLPLLARGNHEALSLLAKLDLTHPKKAEDQLKLAEGWLFGVKIAPEASRTQMLLRAYHWYLQALYQIDEKDRARVEKAMLAIMERVPPEYRVGEIVEEFRRCEGHQGPVYGVAFSLDGRRAVSGGADGSIRVWDARMGKEIKRFDPNAGRIWAVAFSPDGRSVASGSFDNSVRVFDLATGREKRLRGHKDYVRGLAFSPTGARVVSAGDDGMVRLWEVASGDEIQSFKGHEHFVWSVAISNDGKHVLSGSLDKTVRLWDVPTGRELRKMAGHKDTVLSVAFSPDNRRALSASTDGTIKLWDLDQGEEIRTLRGHKGYVHSVAFSPDGRRALSAGADQTIRLWDVHSGEEVRRLEGSRAQVWSVAFSRDGRLAVSGAQDGAVRVWSGAR